MAITAPVQNGKLEYDYSSTKKETGPKGANLGYDQFLQLLCAEMQYQDPLEPTSNTDYVAQLATFSQLEATLSMENTQQSSMANTLVGQQVLLKVTDDAKGTTAYVDGKVDYVMYQDGQIYLSVKDALYPLSTLDTVSDSAYYEALTLSKAFTNMVNALPDYDNVNTSYKSMIQSVRKIYDDMTDYQKQFVNPDKLKDFTTIENRLNELLKAEEATGGTTDGETDGDTDTDTDGDKDKA